MRVNVYAEELTPESKLVVTSPENTDRSYCGIRVFLESPPKLHHSAEDDDRSAVTFWGTNDQLKALFKNALSKLA